MPIFLRSWEVNLSVVLTWINNRRGHDGLTNKHLCLNGLLFEGLLIVVELKAERPIIRPFSFLFQVNGVQLLEERVTSLDAGSACLQQLLSERVRLLTSRPLNVVVPGKGIKSADLMPPRAQLFSCVLIETADVCAHHLDAENLEKEVATDRQS